MTLRSWVVSRWVANNIGALVSVTIFVGIFALPAQAETSAQNSAVISSSSVSASSIPTLSDSSTSSRTAAPPTDGLIRTKIPSNKTFTDDSGITDVKIRADSGSMSRYSVKFAFSYAGPPVGNLGSLDQPNPDGSVGNHNTSLGGAIAARYRLDPETAINFGTGVSAITPFQELKRFDVRTPYISWDRTYRFGKWQLRQSPGFDLVTTPEYAAVGEYGNLEYDAAAYRNIGNSRWSAGLDLAFGYYLYKRPYMTIDKRAAQDNLGLYPTLKYRSSDSLGWYTSFSVNYWNPRSVDNQVEMLPRTVSQRFGFEYAFTRDIYLSPYISFYPQSMNINSTTINFNSVFSIM